MGFKKTKGKSGEASKYVARNKACDLLQLRPNQLRRLCILKGIYPREPKSRKKAQMGDMRIKTLYLKKDIVYLSHEPMIWKIREEKIYKRKLKTLLGKNEKEMAEKFKVDKRPKYKLDHIVLERYPEFKKALQDLDDPLSTCFLYSTMPIVNGIFGALVENCRQLTTEFLNYVIEAKALRKAFISFKGYYYRAHINGVKVTWLVPHPFSPENPGSVNLNIMRNFVEIYITTLGFVNFKLYEMLNLHYPPKFPMIEGLKRGKSSLMQQGINVTEALSLPLARQFVDKEAEDEYDPKLLKAKNDKNLKLAQEEMNKVKKQMSLFEGVKFFLGRETNKESLTFVIRSCGGLVSWDASIGPGATYDENDKEITYQIADRPLVDKKHLSRYYIQPQWIYDSFNTAMLLPVQNYFVDVELPAHLSPFDETFKEHYTPPEMERLKAINDEIELVGDMTNDDLLHESEESEEEEEVEKDEEELEETDDTNTKKSKSFKRDPLARMKVEVSRPVIRNEESEKEQQSREDFRLAATLIHRKQQYHFKKILRKEKRAKEYGCNMKNKRILYEQAMNKQRKKKAKSVIHTSKK